MTIIFGMYLFISKTSSLSNYTTKFIPLTLYSFVITLFSTINPIIPFQKILSFLIIILIVVEFWKWSLSSGNLEKSMRLISFTFTIFMVWGLINMLLGVESYSQFGGRFNGIQRNPNGTALFSSMLILFIYTINKKNQFLKEKELIVILSVLIISTLLTGSRNGVVAIIIFFSFGIFNLNFKLGLIAAALFFVLYDTIIINLSEVIINSSFDEELRVSTLKNASGRVFVWKAAGIEIQNFMWFGQGYAFDLYGDWKQKYFKQIPELIENFGNIHSSYLTYLMNLGIVGTVLFYIPCISIYYQSSKKIKYASGAFFAFLFLATFESWMAASLNPFIWIFWSIPAIILNRDLIIQ